MAWLHVLRTQRFTISLINWGLVDFLWISVYMLAVLAFTAPDMYPSVVPLVFWAIIGFTLMGSPTWVIGNWMRHYVNMGIFEEHEMLKVNHTLFLAMRIIPSLSMALIAGLAASLFLYAITGVNPLAIQNPLLLAASLLAILAMATLYSLTLAYLSLYLGAPAPALDLLNFMLFIVGGIAVPVGSLPEPLRWLAIATPYSHPAEIMRHAIAGLEPYLGLHGEALASALMLATLILVLRLMERKALSKARREGVRGIGAT